MFGNKDEADKCLGLARKYLGCGDHVKARKFALKADQLFPSEEAKRLLRDVDGRAGDCNSNADDSCGGGQQTRHRTTSVGGGSGTDKCYTQEQVDAVQRIRHSKDFYEILSVDKDASDDDLKRSYKRLALKFHPDKNKAPGATEAFKMIGKAFAVLSDPEKRKQYDHTGSVDDVQPRMRNGFTTHEYYDYSRGFETDFSAEELFNIFFGTGNLSGFTARTARHRPTPTHEREQSNYAWVQFLPLLFLFCMSLFSGLFVRDPLYQLHRTDKYSVERHTSNLHVSYFVKSTFDQDHGRSAANIQQLDREVEADYINDLRYKCLNEKQQKESLIFRARYYGDEENYNRYSKMSLPSCQRLEAIYG